MTEKNLKISVVVPSYNQGRYIGETLSSLVSQNYSQLEIIVIDGGSTDNSVSVIETYADKITYWVSEKDNGQSEAINKGFAKASGDIITWLNSDDVYEPGTLRKVAACFEADPSLAILHGKSVLFGEGREPKPIGLGKDIAFHEYFPYMRFPQPSSFLRAETLREVLPVNNNLHYAMDFELVVKILLNGGKIMRSDDFFSRYRIHGTSKSNENLAFLKEWSGVVANLFHSLEGGKVFLGYLSDLKLISKELLNSYPVSVSLTGKEMQDVFLGHLNICYHSYYRECDKISCTRIAAFIRQYFPVIYASNNYRKYQNRLKFIPKFAFRFIRKA